MIGPRLIMKDLQALDIHSENEFTISVRTNHIPRWRRPSEGLPRFRVDF